MKTDQDHSPTFLQWTHHPLAANPSRAALVLLLLLILASLVVYWLGGSAVSAALIVALVFSLRDFFFPSSCLLDEAGFSLSAPLTGTRREGWESVERWYQGQRELKLHLKGGGSLKLPPAESREDLAKIHHFLDAHVGTPPPDGSDEL